MTNHTFAVSHISCQVHICDRSVINDSQNLLSIAFSPKCSQCRKGDQSNLENISKAHTGFQNDLHKTV